MSNWSRTSKYMDHGREYVLSNGFAIPLFNNIPQAAGINDKKWDLEGWTLYIYHWFNCNPQAANTKPEFTPEQQEMIDWCDCGYKNNMVISDIETATFFEYVKETYIEIINKHRSK